ncbi:CAP domain-containing protein [Demequina capsici]|uniref:CAP domain-containing protein n=1 Tax=Demequina capsici TaxID=3075620 RepID=A0AA96FDA2_9MICO|nr:CAP domain-containing protein [Demequina sp. PMTSA13]WNM27818.1 CAP domain-containing protein [Demequina sp. PMTSA13]
MLVRSRSRALLAVLVTVVTMGLALAQSPVAHAATTWDDPAQRIVDLTNQERASYNGAAALTRSASLDAVAQGWAEQLAANYAAALAKDPTAGVPLSHNPNTGTQIPSGWSAWGENVAWNKYYSDPVTQLANQWIASSGHHANMVSKSYNYIGVGYYKDKYGVSWGVQVFGGYSSSPDPSTSTSKTVTTTSVASDSGDSLTVRRSSTYYIKNELSGGEADEVVTYGRAGDTVLVGDWDGDGVDTLMVRRGNTFYVKNSLSGGNADKVFVYGRAGDVVLVGDWNGDGIDTLAVRRGNTYYLRNSLSGGDADTVLRYGRSTDTVLVGDWNGNGRDTLMVRRGSTYYVSNDLSGGNADAVVTYGRSTDTVLPGDWDGDGVDTLTVRRGSTYYIKNELAGGDADGVLTYGRSNDVVLPGNWDGE